MNPIACYAVVWAFIRAIKLVCVLGILVLGLLPFVFDALQQGITLHTLTVHKLLLKLPLESLLFAAVGLGLELIRLIMIRSFPQTHRQFIEENEKFDD